MIKHRYWLYARLYRSCYYYSRADHVIKQLAALFFMCEVYHNRRSFPWTVYLQQSMEDPCNNWNIIRDSYAISLYKIYIYYIRNNSSSSSNSSGGLETTVSSSCAFYNSAVRCKTCRKKNSRYDFKYLSKTNVSTGKRTR